MIESNENECVEIEIDSSQCRSHASNLNESDINDDQ